MTIEITIDELIQSNTSLLELGNCATLPAAAAMRIARVIRKSRDELRDYTAARAKIYRAAGEINKEAVKPHPHMPGEVWLITERLTLEEADAIAAQMKAIGEEKMTIEVTPLTLADLGDKPAMKPTVLADLHWLIKEK